MLRTLSPCDTIKRHYKSRRCRKFSFECVSRQSHCSLARSIFFPSRCVTAVVMWLMGSHSCTRLMRPAHLPGIVAPLVNFECQIMPTYITVRMASVKCKLNALWYFLITMEIKLSFVTQWRLLILLHLFSALKYSVNVMRSCSSCSTSGNVY